MKKRRGSLLSLSLVLFLLVQGGCSLFQTHEVSDPGPSPQIPQEELRESAEEPSAEQSRAHRSTYTLSRDTQGRLFAEHRHAYLRFLVRELIPRIEHEIPLILQAGYADELDAADLQHVHVRYPKRLISDGGMMRAGTGMMAVAPASDAGTGRRDKNVASILLLSSSYHLLYHSHENPFKKREQWIEELAGYGNAEISSALRELERSSFDYYEFFYGNRTYSPPGPLPRDRLEGYRRLWQEELALRSLHLPDQVIEDRITFLIGHGQTGYDAAYRRLFCPRSVRSYLRNGRSLLKPARDIFYPDFWHPVTIYFFPLVERSPADGELVPTQAAFRQPEADAAHGEAGGDEYLLRWGGYLFQIVFRL